MTTTVHATIETVYNADSAEWCPVEGFQDLLLCGTYQLEENDTQKDADSAGEQVRVGRLYLYRLQIDQLELRLETVWERDMPGILDIKWCTHLINDRLTFGLVNSVGELQLYQLATCRDHHLVQEVSQLRVCPSGLGLSLEWDNLVQQKEEPYIAVSDSHGCVSLIKVGSSEKLLELQGTWKAHDFEAWITAFNQWDSNILFTGGDDCRLKSWDLRTDCKQASGTSKRHTMGVCSIQSSPVHEHIIATGSYDEQLLVWDSRQMKRPIAETSLGGGIWRIKWEPKTGNSILSATMYNGFHIVDSSALKDGCLKTVNHFEEHQSIGYGADWCRLQLQSREGSIQLVPVESGVNDSNNKHIIATCSFYDHILKLWDYGLSDLDSKDI